MTATALELYEHGLAAARLPASAPYRLRADDGDLVPFPLTRWIGEPDPVELAVLGAVAGPALDVGCGPGRHVRALRRRGVAAVGLDLSAAVVSMARRAGAPAVHGSIFAAVPAEGRWAAALLFDGNLGIGGDPGRLLRRVGEVLRPGGSAFVEFEPAGVASGGLRLRIEGPGRASNWFAWARVSVDEAERLALATGFHVAGRWSGDGRCFARLALGERS